jgi:hypothetical protein
MAATYEPIASQTFSNAASVTFSGISGSFSDLVLQGYLYGASGNADPWFRMGNGSADTGTNYSETELYGDGSSAGSQRLSSNDEIRIGRASGVGSSSSVGFLVRMQVMSYANTNVYKTVLQESGRAGSAVVRSVGLWRSTSAVDVISISASVNLYGTLSLFGIKAA